MMKHQDEDLGLLCKECGDIWQIPFAICPTCKSDNVEPVYVQDGGEITELIYILRENGAMNTCTPC